MSGRRGGGRDLDDSQIEFLVPRSDLFGSGHSDFTRVAGDGPATVAFGDVDDQPLRAGSTVLAALGLVACIGVGVVAAAPWSSTQTVAPPNTTTAPSPLTGQVVADPSIPATTRPPERAGPTADTRGPNTDLVATTPGYVLEDPPEGFNLAGASTDTTSGNPDTWLTIWAQEGSDRTNGVWLAGSTTPQFDDGIGLGRDATAVQIGDVTGLLSTQPDGIVSIVWQPDTRSRFQVAAGGMPLDQIVAVAAGMSLVPGEARPNWSVIPVDGSGAELSVVLAGTQPSPDLAMQGADLGGRVSFYDDPTGATALVIGTHPYDEMEVLRSRFLLATAHDEEGSPLARHFDPMNEQLTFGVLPGAAHVAVVQWREAGDWVTMLSTLPALDVLRASRTVRIAGPDEWAALLEAGDSPRLTAGVQGVRSNSAQLIPAATTSTSSLRSRVSGADLGGLTTT